VEIVIEEVDSLEKIKKSDTNNNKYHNLAKQLSYYFIFLFLFKLTIQEGV